MKDYTYTHKFTCKNCGIEAIRKNKDKSDPKKYCSSACSQKARIGTKLDESKKIERATKSFEKNVIRKDGCWEWKGRLIRGYGYISCKGLGSQRAHRVSYIIHKGKIPDGLHILHSCHNRYCTNPEHLRTGTQKENIEDKFREFRQAFRITQKKADAIKVILKEGGFSINEIAKIFNASKSCVIAISKGKFRV